jgi:hypothetical protein
MKIGEKTMKNLPPNILVIPMKMTPVSPKAMMATLCDVAFT